MQCPKCNQPVAEGVQICSSCGQAIGPAAQAGASTLSPPSSAAAGPAAATWAGTGGATPGLIDRFKNILLSPKSEWPVIEREPTTVAEIFKAYVVPLAAVSAVLSFIGMSVIGFSIGFGFGTLRVPIGRGLAAMVASFLMALIGVYLFGLIIDFLAPTFSGQRDQRQAMKTAAYVYTISVVSAVFDLVPGLGRLLRFLAALYGIYLLYLGLPIMMRSPREKSVGYTAVSILVAIVAGVVFAMILSVVGRGIGINPFGFGGYGDFRSP